MEPVEPEPYVAPAVSDLGTVTGATLGNAGFNEADDTQYWES
ncbi:putative RiPP precursor [Streptomyces agglomeratus]|nr:putative RiPP precursor [Streptomyces agglomeratus]